MAGWLCGVYEMVLVRRGGTWWRTAVLALLRCATVAQAKVLQLPGGVTMTITQGCPKSKMCQIGSKFTGEKIPRTARAFCVSVEGV